MNMKRYAKYHFLKNIILLPVLLFIGFVITSNVVTRSWWGDRIFLTLSPLAFFAYACAMVMPIIEFKDFTNKRNLDTIYSLPISRKALFAVHYLTGLVYVLVPYVFSALYSFAQMTEAKGWSIGYFWPYFFMELLFVIALYSFMTLAVVIGNTLRDGVVLVLMYHYFPSLLMTTIAMIVGRIKYGEEYLLQYKDMSVIYEYTTNTVPSSVSSKLSAAFEEAISEKSAPDLSAFGYVVFVIIGIAALFAAHYVFTHKRTVLIGEATTSPLGFTTIIPATTLLLYVSTYNGGRLIAIRLMLLAITYIAYALQYRSLKIGKKNLIVLGVLGVLAVLPLNLGIY